MTIDQRGQVGAAEAAGGPAGGLVVPLQALDRDAVAVAGGKGANLGELIRAGFPVPPGFCLTTSAYALATAGAGLETTLAALATLPPGDREGRATLAARVRETILATPVPEAVQEALRDALGALAQGAPLAVRSSATAEDLPFASFAGQQDTVLNVVGADAVQDAVRRCWASLWTERAVAYRAANGIDPRGVRLAVVVQVLVDAAVAGVLFTADPLTGRRRRAVIDASPGLGEAVVSGAVTPDHFVVDSRRGAVLERRRGEAGVAIVPTPGGGTQRVDLARTDGGAGDWSRLSDAQLVELARLGAQVEARFGAPQDVEFAFDQQGRLWLTQARPITTLFPLPAGAPANADDLRVYFSFNVAQGVPQPFTPAGVQAFRLIASGITAALGTGPADPAAGPALL
ncbi:MAG TPA: PEP/pyruvate-binding domain-containing protein, partial [Chloroflexota bacterium]|nr:PEP/pyruvate-binding domain-containing protein [Chloroflexota bacterium]